MHLARCTLISPKTLASLHGKSTRDDIERAEKLMGAARTLVNSVEGDESPMQGDKIIALKSPSQPPKRN